MNKATIKVLIAMLLWGSLGVFVKNISLDSVEIAFFRGIIGSVFLGIVLFIRMQNNKKLEQENDKLNNDFEDEDKKPSKKSIIILIISGMAIGLNCKCDNCLLSSSSYSNICITYIFKRKINFKKGISRNMRYDWSCINRKNWPIKY